MKDFIIPLVPFSIDFILRILIIEDIDWWLYFNSSTLVLTFSLWSVFLIWRAPKKPIIPSDTEAQEDIDYIRGIFTIVFISGFMIVGIIQFTETMVIQFSNSYRAMHDHIMPFISAVAIFHSLFFTFMYFISHNEISRRLA